MYAHGYPQRVCCKHCKRHQVENFTRTGRIYVVDVGGQYSCGIRQSKVRIYKRGGAKVLRDYAKEILEEKLRDKIGDR